MVLLVVTPAVHPVVSGCAAMAPPDCQLVHCGMHVLRDVCLSEPVVPPAAHVVVQGVAELRGGGVGIERLQGGGFGVGVGGREGCYYIGIGCIRV